MDRALFIGFLINEAWIIPLVILAGAPLAFCIFLPLMAAVITLGLMAI